MSEAERRQQGVRSVEVGVHVLAGLASASGPVALGELARVTGMAASKVHRYLVGLAAAGMVRQDPVSGLYDLGEVALAIGLAALNRLNVVQLATRAIVDLNQALDVTVMLSIWGEHGPVVVGWHDASEVVICNVHVGSILPLLRTATGRVFLAHLPRRTTAAMVAHELDGIMSRVPDSHVHTPEDVEALIVEVHRQGLGVTREEFLPGLSAVAAPIFDHQARIVASIAILGLRGTIDDLDSGSYATGLRQAAREVSTQLGHAAG